MCVWCKALYCTQSGATILSQWAKTKALKDPDLTWPLAAFAPRFGSFVSALHTMLVCMWWSTIHYPWMYSKPRHLHGQKEWRHTKAIKQTTKLALDQGCCIYHPGEMVLILHCFPNIHLFCSYLRKMEKFAVTFVGFFFFLQFLTEIQTARRDFVCANKCLNMHVHMQSQPLCSNPVMTGQA